MLQMRGREARGSGLTTSCSLGELLLFVLFAKHLSANTCGQAEDLDEARGILLVVALTHGEGGESGGVEGNGGRTADDRDVAFIKSQLHGAGHVGLGVA